MREIKGNVDHFILVRVAPTGGPGYCPCWLGGSYGSGPYSNKTSSNADLNKLYIFNFESIYDGLTCQYYIEIFLPLTIMLVRSECKEPRSNYIFSSSKNIKLYILHLECCSRFHVDRKRHQNPLNPTTVVRQG